MKPNATTSPLRAATYSRYSSDRQRDASLEDQQRNCRARAEREGWAVVANFADAAISGSDNTRPQYLEMLAAAKRQEFDVLIIDQLSRLARDSVEQEQTIRRLEHRGIRILSTSDGYDSSSASRKVHRGVKGLMNELFLDDLSANVHRGLKGQAIKKFWCGGRPYGYRLKLLRDPHRLDLHGEPAKIGTLLQIDEQQAPIVLEIFTRFVAGESCLSIAHELNERAVPSPGSSWKRVVRRCSGWMASAVRGILRNPLYTGQQRWNVSQFVRDPDTKKHERRKRPQEDWVSNRIEALRIIGDELFQAAQRRTRQATVADPRLKNGQQPRWRLSGLLQCSVCGSHYVLGDAFKYVCSGYAKGRACKNGVRVRRDALEETIIGPVIAQLRDPGLVEQMGRLIERGYAQHLQESESRAQAAPRELEELNARIPRLRARLTAGDPDMSTDEIQAAIDRAEQKRRELQAVAPQAGRVAKVLALLPKAAKLYLRQLDAG